jgi:hypothetical protein
LVRVKDRQQKLLHNIFCSLKGTRPILGFKGTCKGDKRRGALEEEADAAAALSLFDCAGGRSPGGRGFICDADSKGTDGHTSLGGGGDAIPRT